MRATLILVCTLLLVFTVGSATVSRQSERPGTAAPPAPLLEQIREQGLGYVSDGEWSLAAEKFRKGHQLSIEHKRPDYAARFLINLANAQFRLFEYRAALETYFQAKTLAAESRETELAAVLTANISSLYLVMGAVPESLASIEEALALLPDRTNSAHLPRMLVQRATLEAVEGDLERAEQIYLEAFREADRRSDSATTVRVLDQFGGDLFRAGRLSDAERMFTEAFRLRKMSGQTPPDDYYRYLAHIELARGSVDAAESMIERAFARARESKPYSPLWSLFFARARIREAQGRRAESLEDLRAAMDNIESLRLHLLPAHTTLVRAGEKLQKVYDAYIETCNRLYLETGRPEYAERSFLAAERNRAMALRQEFGMSEDPMETLPPRYWAALRQLGDTEESLFQNDDLNLRRQARMLRQELMELELESGLENSTPLEFGPGLSLNELAQALGSSETLFAFQVGEPASFLWVLSGAGMRLHQLPGREWLEARVHGFVRSIRENDRTVSAEGEELYAALFGELGEDARRNRDWILLPDESLFRLPFAALPVAHGNSERREGEASGFLVEEHSLRILPAASYLAADNAGWWRGPFIGLSDPVYNSADPRYRRSESGQPRRVGVVTFPTRRQPPKLELVRLAGSGREAQRCATAFDPLPASSTLLAGERASLEQLQREMVRKPGILHFSTHVVPGTVDPRAAHLALSLRRAGDLELLGSAEISRLNVRPSLVVMSGCDSGRGEIVAGEGLMGLTHAWLRAGAARVAATHWPTQDDSGEMLSAFYSHLGGFGEAGFSTAPHRALRMAQVEMIQSGGWRARPDYWAAYFLMSKN